MDQCATLSSLASHTRFGCPKLEYLYIQEFTTQKKIDECGNVFGLVTSITNNALE